MSIFGDIFGGKGKAKAPVNLEIELAPAVEADAGDQEAFREYLRQAHRQFRIPGIGVGEEFELWLADRAKKKAAAAAELAALQAASGDAVAEPLSASLPQSTPSDDEPKYTF